MPPAPSLATAPSDPAAAAARPVPPPAVRDAAPGDDPAAAVVRAAGLDRRGFLARLAAFGVTAPAFAETLWAQAEHGKVTAEALACAEQVAGLEFTDAERELMLDGLSDFLESYAAVRAVEPANAVPPALLFSPVALLGGEASGAGAAAAPAAAPAVAPARAAAAAGPPLPSDPEAIAFAPATDLGRWLRAREISSVELTRLYLERLERWDPLLECVVTLTPERALAGAERADREIAAGRWRGPLHGVPWGAKDLLAARGYPTTWGATPYQEQVIDEDATVVQRLDEAGAVLVAKLTLGALAWGDVWFGGMTRSPWNPAQGSSGSSAGSASTVAAGLVGFAIGSETWGSIVSPATRCGATGLRPTFGRVSRHGAMALAWSMDKLGPLARSVDDCAHVLAAIHGSDGLDPTVVDRPFSWDGAPDPRRLRVGYVRAAFEEEPDAGEAGEEAIARAREWRAHDLAVLEVLRGLGIEPAPFDLPSSLPVNHLAYILSAEAATAFDALTRSNRDDLLVRQIENAWPNVFRQARLIPAVEYLQANRVRTLLLRAMEEALGDLDAYVCPSFGGDNLLLTNLTGHPCVVLPNGFRADGTPTSITFCGRLHREPELLALARAYQQATDWHLRRPDLEAGWEKKRAAEEAAAEAAG
jgi:Asp-tRNA(Asn)/Glu-tRNA(Gln) amidotransferase A subunit family amidase